MYKFSSVMTVVLWSQNSLHVRKFH